MKRKPIYKIKSNPNFLFIEKILSEVSNGMVAGGCFKDIMHNKTVKDFDIFFLSKGDYLQTLNLFKSKYKKAYSSENCEAFYIPCDFSGNINLCKQYILVELINKRFGTPENIIKEFDLRLNKIVNYRVDTPDGYKIEFLYDDNFEKDIRDKKLFYKKSSNPIGTLQRVLKYHGYGYTIGKIPLIKLISDVAKQYIFNIFRMNMQKFIWDKLSGGYKY